MTEEQQRKHAEAKAISGLFYVPATDRFRAKFMAGGKLRDLGYFRSAAEGAAALEAARRELPSARGKVAGPSLAAKVRMAIEAAEKDARGNPLAFTVEHVDYDGAAQRFEMRYTHFMQTRNGPRPYLQWASTCKVCDEPFEFRTSTDGGNGLVRTCKDHRGNLAAYFDPGFDVERELFGDEPRPAEVETVAARADDDCGDLF